MNDDILGALVRIFSFPTNVDLRWQSAGTRIRRSFRSGRRTGSLCAFRRLAHSEVATRTEIAGSSSLPLAGEIDVEIAHGGRTAQVRLDTPGRGLLIEPTVWSRLIFASADA